MVRLVNVIGGEWLEIAVCLRRYYVHAALTSNSDDSGGVLRCAAITAALSTYAAASVQAHSDPNRPS